MTRPPVRREGVAVATIAAAARIPMARVLVDSVRRWSPDTRCVVLLADGDEHARWARAALGPPDAQLELLTLADLGIPDSRTMAFRCDREELSYALTPHLLAHLLGREEFDGVLFLKQETFVVGPLDPLTGPLQDAEIVLTPHLLDVLEGAAAVERELLVSCAGIFNGGAIGVRASHEGRAFTTWWAERIGDDCRRDLAAGLHYEQRWLDLVPGLFPGTRVLRDRAANVGHWNMRERRVSVDDERVLVDGAPGCLVRFSGFDPADPGRVTRYAEHPTRAEIGGAAAVLDRYREALLAAGHEDAQRRAYSFGAFDDGVAIPQIARDVHRDLGTRAASFGDPFATGPQSFRAWIGEPVTRGEGPDITRLWQSIWRRRPDLQRALPDPLGTDRAAFAAWPGTSGRREHGVPDEL